MYNIIIINPEIRGKTWRMQLRRNKWYNQVVGQHNSYYLGILLLLLVRSLYLGMCPGVHLNTHTSIYK